MASAVLLGTFVIVAACGTDKSPAGDSTPPAVKQDDGAQGPAPPPAEADHGSPPMEGEGPGQEPEPLMKFEEANGFEIYRRYCSVCHGESGAGDGFNAFNLDPKPRSLVDPFARDQMSDEELARSISLGGAGRNKSPRMPSWGKTLNSRQIRYVVSYIRHLQKAIRSGRVTLEN
jgi:mono/diheme cytochrome c family protein